MSSQEKNNHPAPRNCYCEVCKEQFRYDEVLYVGYDETVCHACAKVTSLWDHFHD